MKNRIAEFRKALKMTQPQLAELAKLPSYTVIQGYEHGRRSPSLESGIRLARALNTTVEELFELEDDDQTSP